MKKYLVSALAIALIGASIASIAQSAPTDHSSWHARHDGDESRRDAGDA